MFTAQGPKVLCFMDSRRFSTLELAVVQLAQVNSIITDMTTFTHAL